MVIRFVFVGEGPSDTPLVDHLEALCLRYGARQVKPFFPDLRRIPLPNRTVEAKIRAALTLTPDADIVFVHRDADSRDAMPRRAEIENAASEVGSEKPCVPVVPVQETEAWLLLDEASIRSVAEKEKGRIPLEIPSPARVESIAKPKEKLMEMLAIASELSGRRLKRFRVKFPQHRRRLIERLDIDGPISQVPSWQQLCKDIESTLATMRDARKDTSN